jgi:hypothetical protein
MVFAILYIQIYKSRGVLALSIDNMLQTPCGDLKPYLLLLPIDTAFLMHIYNYNKIQLLR